MRLKVYIKISILAAAIAFGGGNAMAMTVQPLVVDMAVAGKKARASIQVVNDGAKALPVEFLISRLELDAKGERIEKPAADEFLVFPPQALVPPGATQVFRIQWTGGPDIAESQSYMFSVNQIPVKLKKETAGVQVVFNFGVVVNVAPNEGVVKLKTIKTEIGKDDKGARRPALTIENAGTLHAYFSDANIVLEAGSWQRTINAAEMRQLIGLGLVQPRKQRRFLLPVDVPPSVTQISSRVDYSGKRPN